MTSDAVEVEPTLWTVPDIESLPGPYSKDDIIDLYLENKITKDTLLCPFLPSGGSTVVPKSQPLERWKDLYETVLIEVPVLPEEGEEGESVQNDMFFDSIAAFTAEVSGDIIPDPLCQCILDLTKDHYELFGVERTAPTADIIDRFRLLAQMVHPDKNKHPQAASAFQRLQQIKEVLSDPEKRRQYDRELSNAASKKIKKQKQEKKKKQ